MIMAPPATTLLSKRNIGIATACALLFLMWSAQLHNNFSSLSKQGKKSAASAAEEQAQFDAQFYNVTTPSTGASSPAPFPPLPPPDYEEYMAICMAVKDQPMDLPEFFTHYYFHLGIRRFYIFDDGSEPPLSTASYPIPSSAITWVYFQPHIHVDKLGGRGGVRKS